MFPIQQSSARKLGPPPPSENLAPSPTEQTERLKQLIDCSSTVWQQFFSGNNPVRLKQLLQLNGKTDPFSEWSAYQQIIRANPAFARQVFLGLRDDQVAFCPDTVFPEHTYILGGSGTGKTSTAVTQLLIQMARAIKPIFIFDLKPEGDRYLRAVADSLAKERGMPLTFFSNRADYKSVIFEPLTALASQPGVKAIAQTILQSLLPIRSNKPDEVFFMNENRELLERVLHNTFANNSTLENIIDYIGNMTRGKRGNPEARGIHGALSDFKNMPHVRIGPKGNDANSELDLARALTQNSIVYVHLDSQSLPLASRSVGRLMLSCLLAEAVNRRIRQNESPEFFVFIDEFHELASENIANLLNVGRSAGARFVLSHQSTASHNDKSVTEVLLQNTSLQILLSEDEAITRMFARIAGEKIVIRHGGSKGMTVKESETESEASGWSSNSVETTVNASTTKGAQRGHDRSRVETWHEEAVSALSPNTLTDLDSTHLTALVRVRKRGEGSDAVTPWRGIAFLQLLYPHTWEQRLAMIKDPWPTEDIAPVPAAAPTKIPAVKPPEKKPIVTVAPHLDDISREVEAEVTARERRKEKAADDEETNNTKSANKKRQKPR